MFGLFKDYIDDISNYMSEADIVLDVPFVPSDEDVVEAMLNLGKVGPKDVLYDLGSGDGRILITAAREKNTRGIGYDIDPVRIADAMEEAGYAGVELLVDFIEEDIFEADISDATVVTMYLLQSVNVQLRPKLLAELKPGTRIVSHAFNMGDWRPDDWVKIGGISIYKWIVPAKVAGAYEWQDRQGRLFRIRLKQKYQEVTGNAFIDGVPAAIERLYLSGDRLELRIKDKDAGNLHKFILKFENGKVRSVKAVE